MIPIDKRLTPVQQCLDYDWMNPGSPEDLYVSQEVYDLLVTLGAVSANQLRVSERGPPPPG